MPIALRRPMMSRFAWRFVMVTSPGVVRGEKEGIWIRRTEFGLPASYVGKDCNEELLKCFHDLIFLTAAGIATIVVRVSDGSEHSDSSWQWSGRCCDTRTISGS